MAKINLKHPLLLLGRFITRCGRQAITAHGLFVLTALLFGTLFAVTTPPFWGSDEDSHFYRIYTISNGDILARQDGKYYGGDIPLSVEKLAKLRMADLIDNKTSEPLFVRDDKSHESPYQELMDAPLQNKTSFQTYTAPAAYSPLAYLGPLAGISLARGFDTSVGTAILWGRLGALLVYVLIVGVALWVLRRDSLRWLVFVVALLPTSLYQAAVISADSLTLALVLLFFAGLLAKTKPYIASAGLLGLAWVKPSYFVLAPLYARFFKNRKRLWIRLAVLIASVGMLLAWSYLTRDVAHSVGQLNPEAALVDSERQISFFFSHLLQYPGILWTTLFFFVDLLTLQLLGQVGGNFVNVPLPFVLGIGIALVAATFLNDGSRYGRPGRLEAAAFAGLAVAGSLVVVTLLYITFTAVGKHLVDGVQGRYFIPFIPFALYALRRLPVKLTFPAWWLAVFMALVLAVTWQCYRMAL